ncbi:helix-turn-helix domain-containing protein [Pseudoduganella sp. FT26W]|uniref:Helix-turn-helix domain-containing protein n=1 Tax=Duganella aquatilis TaxID=2666082 RepID=A0A844DAB8_9BURK|nr:GlxA family transcriptional regulator [Duganella aquatilis]MRW84064.1 helix-turn-helix domain-containing protein [Duganella aquatilis]
MKSIAFFVFPGFELLDFAAVTVFELANVISGACLYQMAMLSPQGGAVASSAGPTVGTQACAAASGPWDTVLVFGAIGNLPTGAPVVAMVCAACTGARRAASNSSGAELLAATGLLDGRRVTTHWARAAELQQRFPSLKVETEAIFIRDGKYWTSAGMTACIDLALAMVEQDHGAELVLQIARQMVIYHRRASKHAQLSTLLEMAPRSDPIQKALDYARTHLCRPLSVEELADVANLSPRQFSRRFRLEIGQSPAKAVESLRLESARELMENSRHPLSYIARESGFAQEEHMRRAFVRVCGTTPQALRRTLRQVA